MMPLFSKLESLARVRGGVVGGKNPGKLARVQEGMLSGQEVTAKGGKGKA
jgi:hypothetical protein